MFNSGIKGNQRCNGLALPPPINHIFRPIGQTNYSKLGAKDVHNNIDTHLDVDSSFMQNSPVSLQLFDTSKVKVELDDQDIESKITAHSIIGLSHESQKTHKSPTNVKSRVKSGNIRATHHETLQRIERVDDFYNHYQHHWFSASLEKFKMEDRSREERIEITRHEFLRHLQQIVRGNVGKPNKLNEYSPRSRRDEAKSKSKHHQSSYDRLVAPTMCNVEDCYRPALPCARHCTLHIMLNSEQVLFGYCTAKFADNTQCSVPVFDISHELPLCPEHARKRDNYKLYQEAKPKKLRKKVKPSAMIRPQKRNKKKKKLVRTSETTTPSAIIDIPVVTTNSRPASAIDEKMPRFSNEVVEESPKLEEDLHMVDQVLNLNESDINTVLSTIQVDDEFSDFFSVNRNEEYEPTTEEAEELEQALAAVDDHVKSLEKLSQSQGLLDSLMDEHALAESLAQIPDVWFVGCTPSSCGDNRVAQTPSYLLPVEPQSHS